MKRERAAEAVRGVRPRGRLRGLAPEAVVLVASAIYFVALWLNEVTTDIRPHAYYVRDAVAGRVPMPANFLYYLAVYALALGRTWSWRWLCFSTSLLMGAAVAAKFAVTRRILAESLAEAGGPRRSWLSPERLSLVFAVALLLAESVPMRLFRAGGYFYLGQIPPNVWHNSTTIFLMPFALMLFHRSWRQLQDPSDRAGLWAILLLVVLNVLVKPSFVFAFVAVYPLFMLRAAAREGGARRFAENMVPVAAAGLLIIGMYALIYALSFGTTYPGHVGQSGVALRPLLVWRQFSPDIPLSLAISLIFPAALVILHPSEARQGRLRYAWALYAASLLIFALLAETGPRLTHGNFFWQAVVCSYILFMESCARYGARLMEKGPRTWRNATLSICLWAHVLSGLVYIPSLLVRGTFL